MPHALAPLMGLREFRGVTFGKVAIARLLAARALPVVKSPHLGRRTLLEEVADTHRASVLEKVASASRGVAPRPTIGSSSWIW